ncbi:hypothetical protein [Pseudomonas sp. MWU12-2345]|uniref:hypothetical protein n=1 Tax=Pseudomonas sp. MWU12-2345 TaxID=2928689 RepID=UPI00200C0C1F|nr:hypothetical protein [Pseudomonas sp. MWU12-2345]
MFELSKTIEEKISGASLASSPFSFFELDELIPNALYKKFISHLPDIEHYKPLPHKDTFLNGKPTRFEMSLSFETPHQDVTRSFGNCPIAGHLVEIFCSNRFATTLLEKFNLTTDLIPYPHLYRDQAGFHLPPHTDIEEKAITFGWYLPVDTSHIDSGLKLYEKSNGKFVNFKTIEYVPNKAFAFMRSENSWHGVKHTPQYQYDRNSLFVTFYDKAFYSNGSLTIRDPNVERNQIKILPALKK